MTTQQWCEQCHHFREREHEHAPSLFDELKLEGHLGSVLPRNPTVEEFRASGRDPADYPEQLYDGQPPSQPTSTSIQASRSIRSGANTLREKVRQAIADAPAGLTDEEGIDVTGMAANTWRPRRRELELLEEIRWEGTRRTRSGRNAKIWLGRNG